VWVDRQGAVQPLPAPPRAYWNPRLSIDGQRVAVSFMEDIWIWNIPRETLTRLTFGGTGYSPLWTPDGKRVTFPPRPTAGHTSCFGNLPTAAVPDELLADGESGNSIDASSWSPDGQCSPL